MLNYIRKATTAKDGHKGELYVHHFEVGFQFLVFKSHAEAYKFEMNL